MNDLAKKDEWVQVYQTVLMPEERLVHLPDDTKMQPLELWVKGFINNDGKLGEIVEITTVTGRAVTGKLVDINPAYVHDFGSFIPELMHIGPQLKEMLKEGQ